MIKLENIHMKFDRVLLENAKMDIYNGQITGLTGHSGCGKTTLLQKIALLDNLKGLYYDFDTVLIHEMNKKEKSYVLQKDICYIMQDTFLFEDFTIYEMLQVYSSLTKHQISVEDVENVLNKVNLSLGIHTYVKNLSGGEKQRLLIACGLMKEAKLFIFDEPFANLDQYNIEEIYKIIEKIAYIDKKMVIISTHHTSMTERFDRVYHFENLDLVLKKDKVSNNIITDSIKKDFYFNNLWTYISIAGKKRKWSQLLLCFLLSFIMSLVIIFVNYNQIFQKTNGESLLNLMNNEVLIYRRDNQEISAKQQTKIRAYLRSDYEVYGDYIYQDINQVQIKGYLPNEEKNLSIYEETKQQPSMNNQKIKQPIFMSYALYRRLDYKNNYLFIDNMGNQLSINVSTILKPSQNIQQVIYLPYEHYIDYLTSIGINPELVGVGGLKVPIDNIDDIQIIEDKISDDYYIYQESVISRSLKLFQFFSQKYIMAIVVLVIIMILAYKIFQILKLKKDFFALKVFGVLEKDLVLMKLFQEGCLCCLNIGVSFIVTCFFLIAMKLLSLGSVVEIMKWICLWNVILLIFIVGLYSFMVFIIPTSRLLRKNVN